LQAKQANDGVQIAGADRDDSPGAGYFDASSRTSRNTPWPIGDAVFT